MARQGLGAAVGRARTSGQRSQRGAGVLPFHARLLDLAHDAVVVRDAQGRITYWNYGATETYGWTAAEAIGRDIAALLSSTYPVPFESIKRALAQHGSWDGELVQRRRDGSELVVESRWAVVQEPGSSAPSILEVSRDVTSRRRAEQALESAYEQIEETLLRTNELAVMAQVADLAKSEFLANMSHEIRTPMNGVMGVAELLLDTSLDAQQREYVGMIQTSAEALLTVINDILDFSKIEAGRLELEHIPCDVRVVVSGARNIVAQTATQKGLELPLDLAPDVPEALIGDPNRLRQILLNLLSNAVKFTSRGEVGLRVQVAEADEQSTLLRFEVRDTGTGIEREALGRLFQSFEQASEATAREYGGTGLGLAISKRLAEMMDGEIGVESTVGVGSTFWFTARFVHGCAVGEFARKPQTDARRAPVVLPRILVAEDAPINQRVTMAMLEKLGYQADVVPNGRAAIEQLGRARYGAILMDCRMPTMDGYEATAAIRQAEQAAGGSERLPIVALTASAVLGVREGCIAAGMDDYLTKPLKSDDLERVLSRWITSDLAEEPADESAASPNAPSESVGSHAAEPSAPVSSPVPAAPALDPENIAQLAELGLDVVAELATIFLDEVSHLQPNIVQAVEQADAPGLGFAAHRLRSEARTWGAHRLDGVLERLEELGWAGSTDGAPALLPELTEAIAEVVAALERLLHPEA